LEKIKDILNKGIKEKAGGAPAAAPEGKKPEGKSGPGKKD
jgi:hypothetical protein